MTFYTFSRSDGPGPWDYPTLGFTATNGAVLNGALFNPPLTDPPDMFWTVGGAVESGITRWGALISPPAPAEPATGSVLVYDAVANESNWVEGDDFYAPGTSFGDALAARVVAEVDPIRPTNGSRAVGKGELVLDVADYGAVGNGSTDDTSAIQSALTAARAAKARLRFGFNKTYIISGTLNPTGVRIEGFGATLKIKAGTTPTYNLIQPSGPFAATDLEIDLNKANTTDPGVNSQGIGIYAFAASGWTTGVLTLRDVRVINGHQIGVRIGTTFAGTDSASVSNTPANLEGVSIDGCKYGIWLQNVAGVKITAPEISNVGADAIWDFMSRDTQVIGGRIDTPGGHGFVSQYSLRALADGLRVKGAGNMGIVFGGGVAANEVSRDFTVQGCVVSGCVSNGFSVDPTKTGFATTLQNSWGNITGNTADSNGMHGFYLHNTKYTTFNGNTAKNHVAASAGGLALDSFGCPISGNTLVGNTYGLKFQGNVAGYGSHRVGENYVAGNVTADYFFDTNGADNTTLQLQGTAIPAIAAPVGSTYRRTTGGASTTFYVKESGGVTSAGWVAK